MAQMATYLICVAASRKITAMALLKVTRSKRDQAVFAANKKHLHGIKNLYPCWNLLRMNILTIPVFFVLYALGNLPDPLRPSSLFVRLLLNIGSKVLLAFFLYFTGLESFRMSFILLNLSMLLSVAFALYAENYSRFFERTDLAQSVFLVNMFAISLPFENPQKFLAIFFLPYLASNAILLAVGFLKELECAQRAVYIENFYRLFWGKKVVALPLCLAMAFLLGVPPLQGFSWRTAFLGAVYNSGRIWSFIVYIVCFYSLGYVYLKWILAIFQKKSSPWEKDNALSAHKIDWFIVLCVLVILGCSFLERN
ncbi:MAG: hypothetical protein LBQ23_02940 [Puniceicoccales bacterium]|jgi:NADH:ubiquinone oxidoreductase subunit 2 (subunit N)|nr:hypothetical protein [Puniceicoccales bacterium]